MTPSRAVVAALLATLACASAAAAADTPAPVAVRDPPGDTQGDLDLVRVGLARTHDGRLRVTMSLAQVWTGRDLRAAAGSPPGSLCAKVWTSSTPPDMTPDFLVCATADATGALRGTVLRARPNQLAERAGAAVVSRPSRRSVALRFSQSVVGRPARLHVAGEATAAACSRLSCSDTAPDGGAVLELRLRAPAP
jgi:hypothetical protein